ncbi:hypothetical protein BJ322DRAFT_1020529 [Thelephora terrestris]|uniref:DUF6830 domain-containing protein n=1 Tax=Thelephora terrestris TaxID=56493 RepID=A0A9P6HG56_9AGAM|nr:hypothetical protein BJ322DRAFT_1020529 [Thelephora terrestris]
MSPHRLNARADTSCARIVDVSTKFAIPDLLPTLQDFFSHYLRDQQHRTIAERRGPLRDADAPFEDVKVWHSVRIQTKGGPSSATLTPPRNRWPTGRCDTAIFSVDGEGSSEQPPPGLEVTRHASDVSAIA